MSTFLQKVVKNDAMKSDPPEIYNWRVYVLTCSACFGGALFGVDVGIIGGVLKLPPFMKKFGTDTLDPTGRANLEANIVSMLQAGCFFGALGASWVADKYGRKPALILSAIIAFIGTVMQTASLGRLGVMYAGRIIAGIGVGAASMLNPLYTSENAPRAIRGALTGLYQLFIVTGVCVAFWINYGNLLHASGDSQYIISLAMQGLPAICLLLGMLISNESPRYLAKTDQWDKAAETLALVRRLPINHEYVQSEINDMREQLELERRLIGSSSYWDLQKEMWLIKGNRNRALISIGLMVCQQMTGTNAINYYAPQIFSNLGLDSTKTSLFATGVYGLMKMAACAVFLLFAADSLGRRRSLLWTSIAQGTAMFYIGFYVRFSPPAKGQAVPPAGYVAIVMIYAFAAFFQFGWGPVCWIYVSEIPTARLRALNVAMAAATQWLGMRQGRVAVYGDMDLAPPRFDFPAKPLEQPTLQLFNFVVGRATPNMLVNAGANGFGTYFIYGSFCFGMFFFTWFLIPETKGMSLEKMDELFGVVDNKFIDDGESATGGAPPTKAYGDDVKAAAVKYDTVNG